MSATRLKRAPTTADLERLYWELAEHGAAVVGRRRAWPYRPASMEELLCLAGDMLRYDPRLLSVLVQWFVRHWRELDLIAFRDSMHTMRCPQALAVVADFVRTASTDEELGYACQYVWAGWPRFVPAQKFFFDLEKPGSRGAQRRLGRNLKAYARWGFIGTERPVVDPVTKATVGRYDAATRRRILDELLRDRESIRLVDYLDAVDHAVSRQQAREDLRRRPDLVPSGRGRGSVWRVARKS